MAVMSGSNSEIGRDGAGAGAHAEPGKRLSPAAERALKEAAERRAQREAAEKKSGDTAELGGRDGPDPVRYGDWENGGIASDF